MKPLKSSFAKLAFQVDRRVLFLEEESYYRFDLSAHEKLGILACEQNRAKKNLKSNIIWTKNYAFIATLFFSVMFMLSNAPTYAKMGYANLMQVQNKFLSSIEAEEAYLIQGTWMGDKIGDFAPLLESKEDAILMPNDGIISALPTPSSIENRISIPSLDVNAPMIDPSLGLDALQAQDWNELEDQIRESLLQGVVHYPGTADPGKKGNFFLTGHSSNVFWEQSDYNTVFARLPKIEIGAEIVVTKNQREYTYVVTDKKEVSPKNVSVLAQGNDYEMTLMTCTPVGTTLRRLIVTAKLKS